MPEIYVPTGTLDDWIREHPTEWFPFAQMGDQILFVNPENLDESYWTKDENYNEY